MGMILIARCECGYISKELTEGTGMLMPPARVPAACASCRLVVSVVDNARARCSRCRGPVAKYWSIDDPKPAPPKPDALDELWMDEDNIEDDDRHLMKPYLCPRCGTERLHFDLVALWD